MGKCMGFVLMAMLMAGCVLVNNPAPSPDPGGVQAQAVNAYERGVQYMGQGRYLLAREQFSEAATLAVTQGLHDDAAAGMARVDAVLHNRRTYYE